jgi:SecD/SecF fusion protein
MGRDNLSVRRAWFAMVLAVVFGVGHMGCQREKRNPGVGPGGSYVILVELDTTGLDPSKESDLAERVIPILQRRIDPRGERNLSCKAVAWDRIEIRMPRPTEECVTKRKLCEKARQDLLLTGVTETQIRDALALPEQQRGEALKAMVGSVKSRQRLFEQLAMATDRYEVLSRQFERRAKSENRSETSLATGPAALSTLPAVEWDDSNQPLPVRIDAAYVRRKALIGELLATNLDVRVLEDLLALAQKNQTRIDGIARLRKGHPDLVPLIDQMVTAYDQYSAVSGTLDAPADLMRLLRGVGVLEFRILASRDPRNPNLLQAKNPEYSVELSTYVNNLTRYGPQRQPGDKYQWFKIARADSNDWPEQFYVVSEYAGAKYLLAHATEDMGLLRGKGWSLRRAYIGRDSLGRLAIDFQLGGTGPKLFSELTGNNINSPLCIILDNEAISAANIRSAIYDSGQITGRFTPQYVDYIVNMLEAGPSPAGFKEPPLEVREIPNTPTTKAE